MMKKVMPLPYCTEEQTLELMMDCEDGSYSRAANNFHKIIANHPQIKSVPSFLSGWTTTECIGRLSDYYRKHFQTHNNYNR